MNYNRKAILKGGKWEEIACLISDFYIAMVIDTMRSHQEDRHTNPWNRKENLEMNYTS